MKKILFILSFLLCFMFVSSQRLTLENVIIDTFPENNDVLLPNNRLLQPDTVAPIEFDVRIKSDPMSIVVSTEDIETNESLQKTLNVITYQNSVFNEELSKLNIGLKDKEVNRIQLLKKYDVNILEVSKINQLIEGTIYLCLGIFLAFFWSINLNIRSNIYNESSIVFKRKVLSMILILGAFLTVIKAIFIFSSYQVYLFDTITKLF